MTSLSRPVLDSIADAAKESRRHHATCDIEFSMEESEFLAAIEEFKKVSGKKFPTYVDILKVMKSLGYRKIDADGDNDLA